MEEEKELAAFLARIGKRLSESSGAPHSGRHRAAFVALRPLIEGALAHGYTMKVTWAALREEKKLSMSYQTFRMHCQRAGLGQHPLDAAPASQRRPGSLSSPDAGSVRRGASGPGDDQERGFRHERVPRKGDIYG